MDLQLRCIASHPRATQRPLEYALSTRYPRIVTAAADLLVDQSTATNAIRATIRTSAPIDKLLYVGATSTFLAFLDNGLVASYAETPTALQLTHERKIGGGGRSVTLGEGSSQGRFALFAKADSPSLWCIAVADNSTLTEPFKLRSDIEGDQDSVNFVDGVFAKVRGKVATKVKSRSCPIAALATHPSLPVVAAAYTNGIVRVWDVSRKEQRNHFDAQLLIGEKIVDVALHPDLPVVALCTTHGRVLTFNVRSGLFRRGAEPALASSKTRDRKRRFRAMCFMPGSPSYLLLLTASHRLLVRLVNKAYMLVNSSRFPKPSRVLGMRGEVFLPSQQASVLPGLTGNGLDRVPVALSCEPAFGLMACTLDNSGSVYLFQRRVDGLPGIRRPLTTGIDSSFSLTPGDAFKGPIVVKSDSLVVQGNVLFSYELGKEETTKLCTLPPGDVRRMEVARDEFGYSVGALIFYYGDDEVDTRSYIENEQPLRYVLCTRRAVGESWNVSEPSEGRSGCFLNAYGRHDRILILANSGRTASLFSFAGRTPQGGQPVRQGRGVQRYKLLGSRAASVFRSPFASWSAVLYHDVDDMRLAISKNAFDRYSSAGQGEQDIGSAFAMDGDTALQLQEHELIIDVRWQQLPTRGPEGQYLGAVMTDKRIYFVHDVLMVYSKFEFQSIARMVVPFAPPSFSWVGPSLLLTYGNALFSVSMDGKADLIAGLSHGECVTALIAALPDRVVYVRPSLNIERNTVAVVSRPYSALSGLLRGMFSLPTSQGRNQSSNADKVKSILDSQDVSQGSVELMDSLIKNNLSPVAYLVAVSEQGRDSMPPLKRAAFLGRMGDIRGAVSIVESEYAKLSNVDAFHDGTELFRLVQRIQNMAFASWDFAAARRCSALLGRKGTFSAFVDSEGGFAAAKAIVDCARKNGNQHIADVMRPLLEKSSSSSIATDSSQVASAKELQNLKRAIRSVNPAAIPLGSVDKCTIYIMLPPQEEENGDPSQATRVELTAAIPVDIHDRLEMLRKETVVELVGSESYAMYVDGEEMFAASEPLATPHTDVRNEGEVAIDSSDDEDDLFVTGSNENKAAAGGREGAPEVGAEAMVPGASGELSQFAQQSTDETRRLLQYQSEQSSNVIAALSEQTHTLMVGQHQPYVPGAAVVDSRAAEIHQRGVRKYTSGRFSSAQKELDMALRSLARGRERGLVPAPELLNAIVYYQMACRLRIAMEEIASSMHASTLPGQMTYGQLATALTTLPLDVAHRVEALVLAVDANMLLNNFGTAAKGLQIVKELGVPPQLRTSLRDKFSICSARGFLDSVQLPATRLCFMTLKNIGIDGRGFACSACPAIFSAGASVSPRDMCPCCGMGAIRPL